MNNIGYAWRGLKDQLGEGIDDQIRRMTFLKGKMVRLTSVNILYKNIHDSGRADHMQTLNNSQQ